MSARARGCALVRLSGCAGRPRIPDLSSRWQTASLAGRDHTGGVLSVAVSPDGTWLATASHDRTVRIWDPASKQALTTMRTEGTLRACGWTSDGTGLVVGGELGIYV
ncbi:WD40 repeat domain-containing protein [Streptomyces sp. NBC_00083]|uniref:WD40 repeat domain-containing protein n=1 Tax=Streptomyces sp. NBC_00083 TaxID=2975647 RepID=UPI00225BE191|nr:hypothetical protein [Streptomyces sp. NBC_00083]MCX5384198.1 hypothetical protein [Streptomyces sp. NBC_00083]